jgi:hypothetical protein
MSLTTFNIEEQLTPEEQEEQAAALAQGEKIAQLLEEDKALAMGEVEAEQEQGGLILGKFKSQEEVVKAYQELEAKMGKLAQKEEEGASEEQPAQAEEDPESEGDSPLDGQVKEAVELFTSYEEEFAEKGELSDEAMESLAKLPGEVLVNAYIRYMGKQQNVAVQQAEISKIKDQVGGDAEYNKMVAWAAKNLGEEEIKAFNEVTASGHVASIKFAVEALKGKYEAAEGREAPMIRGKGSRKAQAKPYRSHAELARDIANSRYGTDPAFRRDVEARLAVTGNML